MHEPVNPHLVLDLHHARMAQLRAEAAHYRLGRRARGDRNGWWKRLRQR